MTGRFARESVQNVSDNARLYASEYGYDQRGNVNYVGIVAGTNENAMTYTYGADNLPTKYTGTANTGTYVYDELDRLSGVIGGSTPIISYVYRNIGTTNRTLPQLQTETSGNGVIGSTTYQYDNNGNIARISTQSTLDGAKTHAYVYDEFNRLRVDQNIV
ncbi:MAG: hypothetical protein IJ766_09020 [Clostridia bacterium]|nr:hypothetical protein [Clostridia bacterium]